jgi:prepilin-type N-terminal cleavage/methylation domain-containing protein
MEKNNKGFTMMEIMVVVVLIAILSMFAIPQYIKVTEQQRGVEALNLLSAIGKAEERFFVINEAYTEDFSELDLDLIDSDTKQAASGTTYSNGSFSFVLSGINDDTGKITATRATGTYFLRRVHESGDICCAPTSGSTDGEEACEMFPSEIPTCSNTSNSTITE